MTLSVHVYFQTICSIFWTIKEDYTPCASICSHSVIFTISEDVYVAAQKAAQCLLQLAAIRFILQGSGDGLLGPLDHQHGGLDRRQTRLHQLGLGNVTPCETTWTATWRSITEMTSVIYWMMQVWNTVSTRTIYLFCWRYSLSPLWRNCNTTQCEESSEEIFLNIDFLSLRFFKYVKLDTNLQAAVF